MLETVVTVCLISVGRRYGDDEGVVSTLTGCPYSDKHEGRVVNITCCGAQPRGHCPLMGCFDNLGVGDGEVYRYRIGT